MRFLKPLTRFLLLLLLVAPLHANPAAPSPRDEEPLRVRVAIISYDDYSKGRLKYGAMLYQLAEKYAARTRRKVVFSLAIGSYSDVLEWYNKELVDVAFLTPQPVVELRASLRATNPTLSEKSVDAEFDKLYIATHATNSGPLPVFTYRGICVVAENSPITDVDKLSEYANQGKINFLFVDPLSISGRILPEYILRSEKHRYRINNISMPGETAKDNFNNAVYTNSRAASVEAITQEAEGGADAAFEAALKQGEVVALDDDEPLAEVELGAAERALSDEGRQSEKYNVAFFYDGDLPPGLRRVSIPELDTVEIPEEVVLVTRSFSPNHEQLKDIFEVDIGNSHFKKEPQKGWLKRYDEVAEWVDDRKVSSFDQQNQMFTLERIGHILRNYERHHPGEPARLALVLSGGGAKCAYQLGAIDSIEAEVAKAATKERGEKPFDIDLVVGTSGGAINALTVALGLTRDGTAQSSLNDQNLLETWRNFSQKDFFEPWTAAYYLLVLFSALLQAMLLVWLTIIVVKTVGLLKTDISGVYRWLGVFIAGLGALNIFYRLFGLSMVPSRNHWALHGWLLMTFNLYLSGLLLLLIGGLFFLLLFWKKEPRAALQLPHFFLRQSVALVLVSMLAYNVFIVKTVSKSSVVRSTLSHKVAKLLGPEATAELASAPPDGQGEAMQMISVNHIKQRLQRDLVITGSNLDVGAAIPSNTSRFNRRTLPSDIYFYYNRSKCDARALPPKCDPPPPIDYQRRFRAFDKYILDVVIGSSSIYPIFPSHQLANFEDAGDVNIIDGGFAHNSPIEAAVMWKATHIILIEASPKAELRESNLWGNAMNAFNHLYTQAQLLDARARGKVEIFTLRPRAAADYAGNPDADQTGETDMCTFDFDRDIIDNAISRGRSDASNGQPRFHRESGEPVFLEVNQKLFGDKPGPAPYTSDDCRCE